MSSVHLDVVYFVKLFLADNWWPIGQLQHNKATVMEVVVAEVMSRKRRRSRLMHWVIVRPLVVGERVTLSGAVNVTGVVEQLDFLQTGQLWLLWAQTCECTGP